MRTSAAAVVHEAPQIFDVVCHWFTAVDAGHDLRDGRQPGLLGEQVAQIRGE
jgi:hypothetical protein